jgi:hypothetical protein
MLKWLSVLVEQLWAGGTVSSMASKSMSVGRLDTDDAGNEVLIERDAKELALDMELSTMKSESSEVGETVRVVQQNWTS